MFARSVAVNVVCLRMGLCRRRRRSRIMYSDDIESIFQKAFRKVEDRAYLMGNCNKTKHRPTQTHKETINQIVLIGSPASWLGYLRAIADALEVDILKSVAPPPNSKDHKH